MDKIDNSFIISKEEKTDEPESACSSSIFIKEEEMNEPESTCSTTDIRQEEGQQSCGELVHVNQEDEVLIPDSDINDSGRFVKEEKTDETESSLFSWAMEDKKKKVIYSEEERILLKQCILASGLLTMPKQADKISNLQKAKTWEDITRNFNSQTKNSPRTISQLKKLWENMKFRRKADLVEPKRTIRTETDKVEVEVDDNELSTSKEETALKRKPSAFTSKYSKRETNDLMKMEAELRACRVADQRLHDKELHELRIKEARIKLQVAEAELEIMNIRKELLLKELKKK